MIAARFATGRPVALIRSFERVMLARAFAHASGTPAPSLPALIAPGGLDAFRAYTLRVCDQMTPGDAVEFRAKLFSESIRLGSLVRRVFRVDSHEAFAALRWLYAGIGIDVDGSFDHMTFSHCYFAEMYGPAACALMSAMDGGVMAGLAGDGRLEFSQRITEGCACCKARFEIGARNEA